MNLKIAICDDEVNQREFLKEKCEGWAQGAQHKILINTFESAEAFLFCYSADKAYDILLLDIQMNKMNGIELAKKIREANEGVQIIFITSFPDFAAEGYEVSALHYLMKPVLPDKLFEVLTKAAQRLKTREKALFLHTNGESVRLPLYEISVLEAQGHYVKIMCKDTLHSFKMSLSDIENMLDNSFFRCHRSYIINLHFVKKITRTEVFLTFGGSVPLSRGLYERINSALIDYFK